MGSTLPDPLLPTPTRTLTGALDLLSPEAVTVPTGQLGTQRCLFQMWCLGDQQWVSSSECTGSWGQRG